MSHIPRQTFAEILRQKRLLRLGLLQEQTSLYRHVFVKLIKELVCPPPPKKRK